MAYFLREMAQCTGHLRDIHKAQRKNRVRVRYLLLKSFGFTHREAWNTTLYLEKCIADKQWQD